MRTVVIATAAVLSGLAASPVHAQTWSGQRGLNVAEQHRFETEQLRLRSQEQASLARQTQLNARLVQQEVQAARAPEPWVRLEPTLPTSPETARRARETTVAGVTQIDDWLDRSPR